MCSKTRYTVHGRGAKHYFHPCVQTRLDVQNDEPPADGLRQITSVRGKLSKDSTSEWIWRIHAFVIFLQQNTKSGSEKRSLNRLIPALNFINERSTFESFKIKGSNYQQTVARGLPPKSFRQKSIIFRTDELTNGRTDGQQIFLHHGRKERFAQK